MQTRRNFLNRAGGAAAIAILPLTARAAAHGGADTFATDSGEITVHPVHHASFVMETPAGTVHVDPVGGADLYAGLPAPDLILVTHEHGDHYDAATLSALVGEGTVLVTNPAVYEMLPEDLKGRATAIANGEATTALGITIDAIPAYNITQDRLQFHPQGRDNGYVLGIDGLTVYVAGDTEGTPEMRALTGIDLAFVPMNLPYTMDIDQAASAVAEFAPAVVYPYHYNDSDIDAFAQMVADSGAAVEVRQAVWYPENGES